MYFLKTPTLASRPDALVSPLESFPAPSLFPLSSILCVRVFFVYRNQGSRVPFPPLARRPSSSHPLSRSTTHLPTSCAQVNLVHYEDAAAACVDAMMAQFEGKTSGGDVFLATDGAPVTRLEMVESCLECAAYEEGAMPDFTVDDGPLGKSMTNPQTRDKLGWEPVYPSFTAFVAAGAEDSFYPKKKVNRWR